MKKSILVGFVVALSVLFISGTVFAKEEKGKSKSDAAKSEVRLGVYNTGEVDSLPTITYAMRNEDDKTIRRLSMDLSVVSDSGQIGEVAWLRDFMWANVDYSYLFKLSGEGGTGFYAGPGLALSAGVAGDGTTALCSGFDPSACNQAAVEAVVEDKGKAQDAAIGVKLTAGFNITRTFNIEAAYLMNSAIDNALYVGVGYKF